MSEQIQTPETGGGELSSIPASEPIPPQDAAKEVKPTETVAVEEPKDVKVEENTAIKIEESKEIKTEEVKLEDNKDVKNQATPSPTESKVELPQEPIGEIPVVTDIVNKPEAENNVSTKEMGDWQQRELELLKKIADLEKIKTDRTEDGLKLELKVREEEIDLLKARVKNLETELQAAMSKPSGKNHEIIENIKQQHEELLSKARGMIFDKTKMVKNQELQIEALTTQVQSLKDINQITKDLLEIRNSEVKAMEERLQVTDAKFKAEKERYELVLKRAQTSTTINDDLRKEYETQLAIFKELRAKYEQRVQALVAENNRLKESVTGTSSG